jgi:hypothetical protein
MTNRYVNQTKYHLFDITGKLLLTGYIKDIVDYTKLKEMSIRGALKRESCFAGRYYISANPNFDINGINKKSNFNPITSKKPRFFGLETYFKRDVDTLEDNFYDFY